MFKRIATILKRLMGCQSSPALEQVETTPYSSAKPLRAKSGQPSKAAQEQQPRKSSPARTPRKQKQEAVPSTTAARKPGKKKPTARQVAMVNRSKPTGSKSKTPASKTRQHVK